MGATSGINIGDVGRDVLVQAGGDIVAGNKTTVTIIVQQRTQVLASTPYKFLASYDIADRDIFHGRAAVVEQLAAAVARHRVIIINGASGSGKSSLVNAGVIPRLVENGYSYVRFREYSNPLAQFAELGKLLSVSPLPGTEIGSDNYAALSRQYDAAGASRLENRGTGQIEAPELNDPGLLLHLIRAVHASRTVIVFDQFERFFINVPAEKRSAFIAAFKYCLDHSTAPEINFIIALRSELVGRLLQAFGVYMTGFLNEAHLLNLLPLTRSEAREAIVNPLLENPNLGIQYDRDFVDEVLLTGLAAQGEGSTEVNPPHLQIVCNRLFEAARQRVQHERFVLIDEKLYHGLGGVRSILNDYLNQVVMEVAQESSHIETVHAVLQRMIDTTGTRRFVAVELVKRELPDVTEVDLLTYIQRLIERRVVEQRETEAGLRIYSLSHEYMVQQVKKWFDPIEMERKRAQETLERGLAEWKNSQALLNRPQVEAVRKWVTELGPEEQTLLQDSEADYLKQEARRRKLRIVSALAMIIFVGAMVILWSDIWQQAENKRLDLRERSQVARELLEVGAVPNAVASLAQIVRDDDKNQEPEARRLLASWAPRLRPLSLQLRTMPDNTVFRWNGRNFLKRMGEVVLAYDGPPVLQSGFTSDGLLVTFDTDHIISFRSIIDGHVIFTTETLDTAAGEISELLSGRLLLFKGVQKVPPQGDEGETDGDEEWIIIDRASNRYAVLFAPQMQEACDHVTIVGTDPRLVAKIPTFVPQITGSPDDSHTVLLTINNVVGAPLGWHVAWRSAIPSPTGTPGAQNAGSSSCLGKVISTWAGQDRDNPAIPQLVFPALIPEKALWNRVGQADKEARDCPQLCSPQSGEQPQPNPNSCIDMANIAVVPGSSDKEDLEVLLNDGCQEETILADDENTYSMLEGVLGNQTQMIAVCRRHAESKPETCILCEETAQATRGKSSDGRYIFSVSPEIFDANRLQVVEIKSLHKMRFDTPVAEVAVDLAVSPNRDALAIVSNRGELLLYRLNQEGQVIIERRIAFSAVGQTPESRRVNEAASAQPFDTLSFLDESHLILAGRNSGMIMVDLITGHVQWSRSQVPLSGSGAVHVTPIPEANGLAIYDERSIQIVSDASGTPLGNPIDLTTLESSHLDDKNEVPELSVIAKGDRLVATVLGTIFQRDISTGSRFVPAPTEADQLTGIAGKAGQMELPKVN